MHENSILQYVVFRWVLVVFADGKAADMNQLKPSDRVYIGICSGGSTILKDNFEEL